MLNEHLYRVKKLIMLTHFKIFEKSEVENINSEGVIKKGLCQDKSLAHLLCQLIYIISFNKRSEFLETK